MSRKTELVGRRLEEETKPRFPSALHGASALMELREKHRKSSLTPGESLELLLEGNAEHASSLRGAQMGPHARYLKIMSGEADYLFIRCSDSRVHRTDAETDPLVGIHISIAGNVVPGQRTASRAEIEEVINLVKPNGIIINESHCNCGAVNERVKWVEGGMKPTGSVSLDTLLHEVMGPTPSENATAQITKLRELKLGQRASAALMYDWAHGGISVVTSTPSPELDLMVSLFNARHDEANSDGKLAERIAKQKPHALAIASNVLPFSTGTIAHALANEVFNTTGSKGGLDDFDIGSVLYAVSHLGVKHIPFIAPGISGHPKAITGMFDKWEQDLRSVMVGDKPVISDMLDSGELVISRLRYDLGSGRLVQLVPKSG
jgi:carbonic anhydrase